MKIKLVCCHNRRPKPVNGVVQQDQLCNRKIGGVDENLIADSKINGAIYHHIFFCQSCHAIIDAVVENGEVELKNIEKNELDFRNYVVGKTIGYKTRFTGAQ
jgi:hypothetical protein